MKSVDNMAGKAEKPGRKNKQRLVQMKSSVDITWCSSQMALKIERNRGTDIETLKICIVDCQGSKDF